MLAGNGLEGVGIAVQLLLAVRQMHQSHHSEHHPLVTGGQIVQHLPRFLPLLLQIVGHHRGEVAVAVLPSLPVGDIRLHAQQAGLHLPHRLVGGDRDHIEGQHHGAVQGRQLVDHRVLDVAGVLLEEQDPSIFLPHTEVIPLEFQAVRADGVLERDSLPHTIPQAQVIFCLFPGTVEVVEHPEPLHRVQLFAVGVQVVQARGHVRGHPVKEGAGLFDAFPVDGQGNVSLLHHTVGGVGDLVHEHGVVLRPVAVQVVVLPGEQDLPLEVLPVEPLVVDGDLGGGAGVQGIEQLGVAQEHGGLVLLGGDGIVDIRETDGFGIFRAELKNPIRPEAVDGNGFLY